MTDILQTDNGTYDLDTRYGAYCYLVDRLCAHGEPSKVLSVLESLYHTPGQVMVSRDLLVDSLNIIARAPLFFAAEYMDGVAAKLRAALETPPPLAPPAVTEKQRE